MKKLSYILFVVLFCRISAFGHEVKQVVIEIIEPKGVNFQAGGLNNINNYGWGSDIMRWDNRVVVFIRTQDVKTLFNLVKENYPKEKVVLFENPFYEFSRINCNKEGLAKEWDEVILTANLVADPKMQQEYLNHHATQLKKWPEVSEGFCRAKFQQLLVFKTGRQLMLVISIPKGLSLDKLNPLTTKNNPRVNDWNNLMKKYQEGIEGTKKGETWVFFKPITN